MNPVIFVYINKASGGDDDNGKSKYIKPHNYDNMRLLIDEKQSETMRKYNDETKKTIRTFTKISKWIKKNWLWSLIKKA